MGWDRGIFIRQIRMYVLFNYDKCFFADIFFIIKF